MNQFILVQLVASLLYRVGNEPLQFIGCGKKVSQIGFTLWGSEKICSVAQQARAFLLQNFGEKRGHNKSKLSLELC